MAVVGLETESVVEDLVAAAIGRLAGGVVIELLWGDAGTSVGFAPSDTTVTQTFHSSLQKRKRTPAAEA